MSLKTYHGEKSAVIMMGIVIGVFVITYGMYLHSVKLHTNFVHFKYSLQVNKKNILVEYPRSLSQVRGTIHTSNE